MGRAMSGTPRPQTRETIGKAVTHLGQAEKTWQRFPQLSKYECLWMTDWCVQRLATPASFSSHIFAAGEFSVQILPTQTTPRSVSRTPPDPSFVVRRSVLVHFLDVSHQDPMIQACSSFATFGFFLPPFFTLSLPFQTPNTDKRKKG